MMKRYSLTILSLFCLLTNLQAQSLYNNSTTLFIGENTVLSAPDSIVNNGTIINNGDIQVAGIWQNNGTYEPGSGQLTLTSSQPQVINHNDQSFTRLNIDGGGEKIFGADIYIENELVLTNGILVSSNNSKITIEDGADIIGGSDESYVDGPVYHVGNGDKFFPLGTGDVFLPVQLLNIQGNAPTIGVLLFSPNPNLEVQGNLDAVTDQEYWQVDVLEGTFEGSGVILPIRDEFFMESIDQAAVAEAASLEVPFQSLGRFETTGDLTTGSVTSSELVTMNFLTIGAIQQETSTELNVFNAVSPNDDGLNDILKIQNITLFPNNIVTIYTRWGDKVFEMAGYDNNENVFKGFSNVRNTKELPEGTYYYVIEKGDGSSNLNGFFVLRN
ncbi:MAG: gliding motility-associated C-terminal domain-containing protein [Cyclobacteriaceae bacterium]|nr:gliding motility-associated C-terminal domain-containing protein [Cyclobacteriaceae bacterium]